MNSSIGCFFLDTNVVLSDIFRERTRILRIEKLKKDLNFYSIPCYVSDSVKNETYEKVQETCNFLGNIVRELIKYQLQKSRKRRNIPLTSPITPDDIKALEELFSYYYDYMKKTRNGFPLPSPLTSIEEWAISYLGEILDQRVEITVNRFLRELVKMILKLTSSFEDLYDNLLKFQKGYIKINEVKPEPLIIAQLEIEDIHEPDSVHLASVITHRNTSKEKSIFVTFDYRTILNKRLLLLKKFKIICCDPLYATYYLI